MRERPMKDIQKWRSCRKLVWKGTEKEGKLSKGLREKHRRRKTCHAPKPTPRAWRSFHTLTPNAQSRNDINIRIVIGNLPITKFLFRVVWKKILKSPSINLKKNKTNTSTKVLLSK